MSKFGEAIHQAKKGMEYLIIYDLETNKYTSGFTGYPEKTCNRISKKHGKKFIPVRWETIKHLFRDAPTRHPSMGSNFKSWHKAGRMLLPFMTGGKIPKHKRWDNNGDNLSS